MKGRPLCCERGKSAAISGLIALWNAWQAHPSGGGVGPAPDSRRGTGNAATCVHPLYPQVGSHVFLISADASLHHNDATRQQSASPLLQPIPLGE